MYSKSCSLAAVMGLVVAAASFCLAQDSAGGKTEQELIKLTQEVLQAEIHKDMPTLQRLLTDDFTHTHANGEFEKKADYMNDLKIGTRNYEVFEPSELKVRLYGSSAIIIGHLRIKNVFNGQRGDTQNSIMVTWVQQQGKWRMAGWATTRGPQPAATGSASH